MINENHLLWFHYWLIICTWEGGVTLWLTHLLLLIQLLNQQPYIDVSVKVLLLPCDPNNNPLPWDPIIITIYCSFIMGCLEDILLCRVGPTAGSTGCSGVFGGGLSAMAPWPEIISHDRRKKWKVMVWLSLSKGISDQTWNGLLHGILMNTPLTAWFNQQLNL